MKQDNNYMKKQLWRAFTISQGGWDSKILGKIRRENFNAKRELGRQDGSQAGTWNPEIKD
jgi:hypothetical protein